MVRAGLNALVGALLVVGTFGCKTIVNCVDEQGNPVNCPSSAASTDGMDGAGSTDGTDGPSSTDGSDGTSSADGTDGASGSDGAGTDATDGASGSDDTDGTDGTDGGLTCEGECGNYFSEMAPCNCDSECYQYDDCCPDYFDVCTGGTDGTDGVEGEDGTDGVAGNYTFPKPFEPANLSYDDCRGLASENTSWCETYDCRAIVKWDKGPCTTSDCKGIASANHSWCDSHQCKGIARGRKCKLDYDECVAEAEGSDAKEACEDTRENCTSNAMSYCQGHKACKAIVTENPSWCGSSDGNCQALARKNSSYCFSQ